MVSWYKPVTTGSASVKSSGSVSSSSSSTGTRYFSGSSGSRLKTEEGAVAYGTGLGYPAVVVSGTGAGAAPGQEEVKTEEQAKAVVERTKELKASGEYYKGARATDYVNPPGKATVGRFRVTENTPGTIRNAREAVEIWRNAPSPEQAYVEIVERSPQAKKVEQAQQQFSGSGESLFGGLTYSRRAEGGFVPMDPSGLYTSLESFTATPPSAFASSTIQESFINPKGKITQTSSAFPETGAKEKRLSILGTLGHGVGELRKQTVVLAKSYVGGFSLLYGGGKDMRTTEEFKKSWVYNLGVYKWMRGDDRAKGFLIEPEYTTFPTRGRRDLLDYASHPSVQTYGVVTGLGLASETIPFVGTTLGYAFPTAGAWKIGKGTITRNPEEVGTGLLYLLPSVIKSPLGKDYETGEFKFQSPTGLPSSVKRPVDYYSTLYRLSKESPADVPIFKEAYSWAFGDPFGFTRGKLGRYTVAESPYTVKYAEQGLRLDLETAKGVDIILAKYGARISGSTILFPYTGMKSYSTGKPFGDVDIQAVMKGKSNLMAAELTSYLTERGYGKGLDFNFGWNKKMQEMKFHIRWNEGKGSEFINWGESSAYQEGQTAPTMGLFEAPWAGWVKTREGIELYSIRDAMRVWMQKGWIEGKAGREKDVLKVKDLLSVLNKNPERFETGGISPIMKSFRKMMSSKAGKVFLGSDEFGVFYHGTRQENVPNILKEGLLGQGGGKKKFVFLASSVGEARSFAGKGGAVFEVKLSPSEMRRIGNLQEGMDLMYEGKRIAPSRLSLLGESKPVEVYQGKPVYDLRGYASSLKFKGKLSPVGYDARKVQTKKTPYRTTKKEYYLPRIKMPKITYYASPPKENYFPYTPYKIKTPTYAPPYTPPRKTPYAPPYYPPSNPPYAPPYYPPNNPPYNPPYHPPRWPPFTPPTEPPKKFKLDTGKMIKKSKKHIIAKFKGSYFPSLEAEVFKIRGAAPSARAVATGLLVRPLAR